MGRRALLLTAILCAGAATASTAAEHPGSDSDCVSCHQAGSGEAAPKVVPEEPGFFAKLLGEKPMRGHESVSCAGQVRGNGVVSGCHRPELGGTAFLVQGGGDKARDLLCGSCHQGERAPGAHHPSYLRDRDGDGVPESVIRPAAGQEVYGPMAAPGKGADTLEFVTGPDGARRLAARVPLQAVSVSTPNGMVLEQNVVTCTSCHNPHFGYLVEVGSEEELNSELVARGQGDALLRMRDYDNALCDACH